MAPRSTCVLLAGALILGSASAAAGQVGVAEIETRGSGEQALLIIPCMSCRWRSWEPFMERNAARWRMTAVTLAGFGGTPVPATPMNGPTPAWRNAAVDRLSELLDDSLSGPVTIVGHSFGGEIAVMLAARRPDRVARVVLVDSWPFSDRSWFIDDPAERVAQANRTVARQTAALATADAWQAFNAPPSYASPERQVAYHGWFMATPREVMLQYWRENSMQDLNPSLRSLHMPVLDIKAISPSVTDADSARADRLANWERNGRPERLEAIFLPDTRHFVMEQRPTLLDSIIARFVGGHAMCPPPVSGWTCHAETGGR